MAHKACERERLGGREGTCPFRTYGFSLMAFADQCLFRRLGLLGSMSWVMTHTTEFVLCLLMCFMFVWWGEISIDCTYTKHERNRCENKTQAGFEIIAKDHHLRQQKPHGLYACMCGGGEWLWKKSQGGFQNIVKAHYSKQLIPQICICDCVCMGGWGGGRVWVRGWGEGSGAERKWLYEHIWSLQLMPQVIMLWTSYGQRWHASSQMQVSLPDFKHAYKYAQVEVPYWLYLLLQSCTTCTSSPKISIQKN